MRAWSEPTCVAAERQKKSHFDKGKVVPEEDSNKCISKLFYMNLNFVCLSFTNKCTNILQRVLHLALIKVGL